MIGTLILLIELIYADIIKERADVHASALSFILYSPSK